MQPLIESATEILPRNLVSCAWCVAYNAKTNYNKISFGSVRYFGIVFEFDYHYPVVIDKFIF